MPTSKAEPKLTSKTASKTASKATPKAPSKTASKAKSAGKTHATDASIEDYIASRASPEQAADCAALMALLARVTQEGPKMWGPSIVGYGAYRYTYDSGRSGESCLTGFAIRGREIVIYLVAEGDGQADLLSRLGPHKIGKACLYIKRLADLDIAVLEQLVVGSIAELRRRHGA